MLLPKENTLTLQLQSPLTLKLQARQSMLLLQIADLAAQSCQQAPKILQQVLQLWVSLVNRLLHQALQSAIKCQSAGGQSRSSRKVTAPSIGKLSRPKKTPPTRARERFLLCLQAKLNRSLRRLLRHQSYPLSKTLATASMSLPMVPNLK